MQIQILYSCNEWKEHSSMKIVCATTNPEVLYALIGESIKAGVRQGWTQKSWKTKIRRMNDMKIQLKNYKRQELYLTNV